MLDADDRVNSGGAGMSSLYQPRLLQDVRNMTLLTDSDKVDTLAQPFEVADDPASQFDPLLGWVSCLIESLDHGGWDREAGERSLQPARHTARAEHDDTGQHGDLIVLHLAHKLCEGRWIIDGLGL